MDVDRHPAGALCWADVMCADPDAAVAFYGSVFGWNIPEANEEFGGYRTITMRDRTVVGMMPQMEEGGMSVWSLYFATDDSAATAAAVTAAGGTVMVPPMDVGDLGKMAVFIDPAGAFFGTWEPGLHLGSGVFDEPDSLCWAELMTTDTAGSVDFYTSVFGWSWGGNEEYNEFSAAGKPVGGVMPKPPMMPAEVPSYWGIYFAVADADATVAAATAAGGSVHMGPMDMQPGRIAVVADPNGATFSVIKLAEHLQG